MRTAQALLFTLLIAGTAASALAAWEEDITDFDRQRLAQLEDSRAKGLAEADAGASEVDRNAIHSVLDPAGGPITAQELTGNWRCRIMKLGGLSPAMVYDWFSCRARQTNRGLFFEKLTGSERLSGYLDAYEGGRFVLLGAITVRDEKQKPYSGGNTGIGAPTSSSDVAGIVSSIGAGRARIEFPYPAIESTFDVIELAR